MAEYTLDQFQAQIQKFMQRGEPGKADELRDIMLKKFPDAGAPAAPAAAAGGPAAPEAPAAVPTAASPPAASAAAPPATPPAPEPKRYPDGTLVGDPNETTLHRIRRTLDSPIQSATENLVASPEELVNLPGHLYNLGRSIYHWGHDKLTDTVTPAPVPVEPVTPGYTRKAYQAIDPHDPLDPNPRISRAFGTTGSLVGAGGVLGAGGKALRLGGEAAGVLEPASELPAAVQVANAARSGAASGAAGIIPIEAGGGVGRVFDTLKPDPKNPHRGEDIGRTVGGVAPVVLAPGYAVARRTFAGPETPQMVETSERMGMPLSMRSVGGDEALPLRVPVQTLRQQNQRMGETAADIAQQVRTGQPARPFVPTPGLRREVERARTPSPPIEAQTPGDMGPAVQAAATEADRAAGRAISTIQQPMQTAAGGAQAAHPAYGALRAFRDQMDNAPTAGVRDAMAQELGELQRNAVPIDPALHQRLLQQTEQLDRLAARPGANQAAILQRLRNVQEAMDRNLTITDEAAQRLATEMKTAQRSAVKSGDRLFGQDTGPLTDALESTRLAAAAGPRSGPNQPPRMAPATWQEGQRESARLYQQRDVLRGKVPEADLGKVGQEKADYTTFFGPTADQSPGRLQALIEHAPGAGRGVLADDLATKLSGEPAAFAEWWASLPHEGRNIRAAPGSALRQQIDDYVTLGPRVRAPQMRDINSATGLFNSLGITGLMGGLASAATGTGGIPAVVTGLTPAVLAAQRAISRSPAAARRLAGSALDDAQNLAVRLQGLNSERQRAVGDRGRR